MIGKEISHYKIIEKLGAGGMGEVYKAEDTRLKRTVALKFLPPDLTRDEEAKKRFIHEAQSASSLDHPNICNIHEIDETKDGQLFIVMACYQGQTLKDKIKDQKLKTKEVLEIALQIAQGLAIAHNKGIIHRDIKPDNIIITDREEAKILDFGLAKLAGRTILTREGTTMGTVAYMSPEQARGGEIDQRTDIWSLGVILYESLTGKQPFDADYDQAVIYNILNVQPEIDKLSLPPLLKRIIKKSFQKDVHERYQSIHELIRDLLQVQNELAGESTSDQTFVLSKRNKLFRIPITILALLAALIIFLSVFSYLNRPALPKSKMLVVLPFANLDTAQHQYFAAGITEEITSRLARLSGLGVISPTTANQYGNSEKTIKQIGEELNVEYVLKGTIRWAVTPDGSEMVRITPHLVRVSNELLLWSESYDRVMNDIFNIQTDIATTVAEKLDITLLAHEKNAVDHIPTQNMEAYHAYLRGRYFASRPHFSLENWQQAVKNFREAVAFDSGFALAHAELSKLHSRLYYLRYDLSEERQKMAREEIEKAQKLAPNSPEVRVAMGYYHLWTVREYEKALEEFLLAERYLPNSLEILNAKAAIFEPLGRWDDYLRTLDAASSLSPSNATIYLNMAFGNWFTRNFPRAIEACNQAIALAPDANWPYLYSAYIHWTWKGPGIDSRRALASVHPNHEFYIWSWYWQEAGEKNFTAALDLLRTYQNDWVRQKLRAEPKQLLSAFIHDYLNESDIAYRQYDSARVLLENSIMEYADDPRYHCALGLAYAGLGRKDEAIREGLKATELLPLSKDAAYGIPYAQDLSVIYTMTGEYDKALEQIEYLLSIPSWMTVEWLKFDFRYAPLNQQPEFKQILKRYGKAKIL